MPDCDDLARDSNLEGDEKKAFARICKAVVAASQETRITMGMDEQMRFNAKLYPELRSLIDEEFGSGASDTRTISAGMEELAVKSVDELPENARLLTYGTFNTYEIDGKAFYYDHMKKEMVRAPEKDYLIKGRR